MDEKCSYEYGDYKCDYPVYIEFPKGEKYCIFHTKYGKKWKEDEPSDEEKRVCEDFQKYLDEYEISEANGFIFPSGRIISKSITHMTDCTVYESIKSSSITHMIACTVYGNLKTSSITHMRECAVYGNLETSSIIHMEYCIVYGSIASSSITYMRACSVYESLELSNPGLHAIRLCNFHGDLSLSNVNFEKKLYFYKNICFKKVDISSCIFKDLSIYGNYFQESLDCTHSTFNGRCTVKTSYMNTLDFSWADINENVKIDKCSLSTIDFHKTSLSCQLYIGYLNQHPLFLKKHFKAFSEFDFIDNLRNTIPSINLSNIDISNQGHITLDELNVSKTSFWKTDLLKDKPCIDFKLVAWDKKGKDYRLYDDKIRIPVTQDKLKIIKHHLIKTYLHGNKLYKSIINTISQNKNRKTFIDLIKIERLYRKTNTDYVPKSDVKTIKLFSWCYWLFFKAGKSEANEIERLYRQIRACYESRNDHGTAGEFYVHEMRTRRENTKAWTERFFNRCYWVFSRYGESILRPLVWLGVMVFLTTSLLMFTGVKISDKSIDFSFGSFIYVAVHLVQAISPVKTEVIQPTTNFWKGWFIIFRILGLAILALLLLSIRRRFFRKS